MSSKTTPLRTIAAALILSVGVAILSFAMTSSNAAKKDFITYWAAGHQLIHHANPYDGPEILALQKSAGFEDSRPFFMRNPPSAFWIALPLGVLSAKWGAVVWSLAILAALMTSIRLLWILQGSPPDRLHLVGYVFPPVLACLLAGQFGIFLLLGVTLFLHFYESRPYVAGASLLLCALKPHLFLPFGVVLLAWILVSRSYRILAGAAVALTMSLALAFFLDPSGWSHYAAMARAANLQDEMIPTLSLAFRLAVHRNWLWLQFVPAFFGCRWALKHYWSNREDWRWTDQGMLVLLVSVLVAPYAWVTDEAVLLPAIFAALYQASRRSLLVFSCIAGIALVEVLVGLKINSGVYLWTAPAWLIWYVAARAKEPAISCPSQSQSPDSSPCQQNCRWRSGIKTS